MGLLCMVVLGISSLQASMSFTDVTDQTGITFKHKDGSSGNFYIVETIGAGLALFDYDLNTNAPPKMPCIEMKAISNSPM
jgi:hypothetical protein